MLSEALSCFTWPYQTALQGIEGHDEGPIRSLSALLGP